jgi:uncharacterized protein (DUF2267 family)
MPEPSADEPSSEPTMPEPSPMPSDPEMTTGDEIGPVEPSDSAEDLPTDDMSSDDMSPDEDEDGDVTFKTIQKLTGKLAQKIRDLQDNEEEISSKDAKYVINSILSAISDNLEDEDKEDIIDKLENEDEDDSNDMGMGSEEPMDMTDDEMPSDDEEIPSDEESTGEMKEDDFLGKVFGNIFNESKVDKILKGYFVINENEKKFTENKKKIKKIETKDKFRNNIREINRLSESFEQREIAKDIVKNFPQVSFVGKTNKGNLVFENKNKQLKVSPNGQIL